MRREYLYHILLFLCGIILSSQYLHAQTTPPAIQWAKSYGGSNWDKSTSIQQTNDGGYIVAGYSYSDNGDVTGHHGDSTTTDYWIVKLNFLGVLQWEKSIGGSGDDQAYYIQQTRDKGYVVAGFSSSSDGDVTGNHGLNDYWIVKLDSLGNIRWQKSLGGHGDDIATSINTTKDGGYIVSGYSNSTDGDVTGSHGNYDYWVVKLDSSGNLQWEKSLGGTGDDEANSIQQTRDGGYIIGGFSNSDDGEITGNHGDYDYWIVKIDSLGNLQWEKSLGGTNVDFAQSVQQAIDGSYYVGGGSYSDDDEVTGNHGNVDYWVMNLDGLGNIKWEKSLGGSLVDIASSIQITSDKGCAITGESYSNDGDVTGNHGYVDYWIVNLNESGNIKWQRSLGGSGDDEAYSIQQTTDGGYIVAGFSNSTDGDVTGNHGGYDYWIVKLAPDNAGHPVADVTNPINAGGIRVNTRDTVPFTIRNTGTANLIVDSITLKGYYAPSYRLLNVPQLPATLAPGTAQTMEIIFSPLNAGVQDATLEIVTNASATPADIAVNGIGERSILAATAVNFDTIQVDSCVTKTMTITNAGDYPLFITRMNLLGAYAGNYTILTIPTDTLHPGDTATVAVRFCPTGSGEEDVIAECITNDGDTLYVNIYGAGRGTSSVPIILPSATSLSQNYPNPFTNMTTIRVTLSQGDAQNAQLKVYNMLGEQVADLTSELSMNADIPFTAEGSKTGVYYYVLQTASGRLTRKMFVIK